MLHATELLGSEAYDAQGNFVGRVKEFYLEPAEQGNRVSRVLLTRGKYQPLLARHDQIGFVAPGTMRLTVEEKDLEHYRPNESWLAVRKDLLDQQIIDTHGRKVVRVNDVDLTEQRERERGAARHASGCGVDGRGRTVAAGSRFGGADPANSGQAAAADDSVGVRQFDRAGPAEAGEAAAHKLEVGAHASGRSGGIDGGVVAG